jgi:hypothetical protein
MTFDEKAAFGSVMPILSIGVRWGRAIERVCKPEVTGSIPVRSTKGLQMVVFVVTSDETAGQRQIYRGCESRLSPQIPAGLTAGRT